LTASVIRDRVELMTVGERVKLARERAGMSKAEFCRRTGVGGAYPYQLEGGMIKSPSAERLARFASALGVSFLWLATGEGEL
jgi:transcriptional regulator with XRE-family HTH domain